MAAGIPDAQINVMPGRSLPTPIADATRPAPVRGGHYNEIYALSPIPGKHLLAEEESYFTATNPTIGTTVTCGLATAFSDTVAMFAIQNTWDPGDPLAKSIYLDYLDLMPSGTAPGGAVSEEFAIKLDKASRAPTAGFVTVAAVNVDSGSSRALNAVIYGFSGGNMTVPASSSSAKIADRIRIPIGLNVAGDLYRLQFGAADMPACPPPLTAVRSTQPAVFVGYANPIRIRPGHWAVIHRWAPTEATTAPAYEFKMALFER